MAIARSPDIPANWAPIPNPGYHYNIPSKSGGSFYIELRESLLRKYEVELSKEVRAARKREVRHTPHRNPITQILHENEFPICRAFNETILSNDFPFPIPSIFDDLLQYHHLQNKLNHIFYAKLQPVDVGFTPNPNHSQVEGGRILYYALWLRLSLICHIRNKVDCFVYDRIIYKLGECISRKSSGYERLGI
ncbi:hypothetical protein LXL04_012738 [Taraxacum kok-saghyz]